jgi:hypothetical protein
MRMFVTVFFLVIGMMFPIYADTLAFYVLQNSNNLIDFRDTSDLKITSPGALSLGIEMGTQLYPNFDWFLGLRHNFTRNFESGSNNLGPQTFNPAAAYDSTMLYYKLRWNLIPGESFSAFIGGLTGFDFSSQNNFPAGVHADVGAVWGVLAGCKLLNSWRVEAGQIWMFPTFRSSSSAFAAMYQESYVSVGYEIDFNFVSLFKH